MGLELSGWEAPGTVEGEWAWAWDDASPTAGDWSSQKEVQRWRRGCHPVYLAAYTYEAGVLTAAAGQVSRGPESGAGAPALWTSTSRLEHGA